MSGTHSSHKDKDDRPHVWVSLKRAYHCYTAAGVLYLAHHFLTDEVLIFFHHLTGIQIPNSVVTAFLVVVLFFLVIPITGEVFYSLLVPSDETRGFLQKGLFGFGLAFGRTEQKLQTESKSSKLKALSGENIRTTSWKAHEPSGPPQKGVDLSELMREAQTGIEDMEVPSERDKIDDYLRTQRRKADENRAFFGDRTKQSDEKDAFGSYIRDPYQSPASLESIHDPFGISTTAGVKLREKSIQILNTSYVESQPDRKSEMPERRKPYVRRPYLHSMFSVPVGMKVILDDQRSDEYYSSTAKYLFEQLKIQPFMDIWSRRMRNFVASLLPHFARRFDDSDKELEQVRQMVLGFLRQRNIPSGYLEAATSPSQMLKYLQQPQFYQQHMPNEYTCIWSVIERRLLLNDQLASINPQYSDYVLQRLRDLSHSDELRAYIWDGGGGWNDKPWESPMPTDADILMTVFRCTLDELIAPLSFTDNHWVPYRAPPNVSNSNGNFLAASFRQSSERRNIIPILGFAIVRVKVFPPYYALRRGNDTKKTMKCYDWAIEPGKDNVFQCLAVLAYLIKGHYKGKLHQIQMRRLHKFPFLQQLD